MTNNFIGNHIAGYENGMWFPGSAFPAGQGSAHFKVCPQFTPFGIIRGNVNHDNWRFGMYPDNQYPRNVERDDDGLITNPDSCEEFTASGMDNGVVPSNIIEDEFDFHNTFVGQYSMGDVMYLRYTSVNNAHPVYWKDSKNFADGKSHHMLECVFANDPADFGAIQLLGPAGPFTFLFTNNTFLGGPVHHAALSAGQNCGRVGAGGPCDVEYLLQGIDWSGLDPTAKRIKFGVNSQDAGYVLPIFLSPDDSLGGHRSMVSSHLKGFAQVPGCTQLGDRWDGAHACESEIRRLNVWSIDLGVLKLSGPGYLTESLNMAAPVHGADAGLMRFESLEGYAQRGYGIPVVSGGNYTVSGNWSGEVAFEFSDPILEFMLRTSDSLNLQINGTHQKCILHGRDDRRFLAAKGPHTLSESLPLPCKIAAGPGLDAAALQSSAPGPNRRLRGQEHALLQKLLRFSIGKANMRKQEKGIAVEL